MPVKLGSGVIRRPRLRNGRLCDVASATSTIGSEFGAAVTLRRRHEGHLTRKELVVESRRVESLLQIGACLIQPLLNRSSRGDWWAGKWADQYRLKQNQGGSMSDIIRKAQRSSEITQVGSLTPSERVWSALEALSGLTLSELNASAKEAVEAELAAINQIIGEYAGTAEAHDAELAESDAIDILSRLDRVSQLCIESESDRVMRELGTAGHKLPVEAIKEVREHRDIFVPLLMRSLEQAILRVRNGGDEPQEDASFFAVFLLTEMNVTESFPIFLEALRLPGDGPSEIFGDGVHELVPALLAQFSGANTDVIGEIVQDSNIDMYVRWSSATTYKYLVRDGLISRQNAIEALHRHFQETVKKAEDHKLLAPLACELGDLAGEAALETIRSAFQQKLVDESIVSLSLIEEQIAAGEETVEQELEHCRPTGMPDTIAELSRWWAFREEPPKRSQKPTPSPSVVPHPHLWAAEASGSPAISRGGHRIGRNDLCPCGSGKKFKKCCRQTSRDD